VAYVIHDHAIGISADDREAVGAVKCFGPLAGVGSSLPEKRVPAKGVCGRVRRAALLHREVVHPQRRGPAVEDAVLLPDDADRDLRASALRIDSEAMRK
jgi:hypothetical protein